MTTSWKEESRQESLAYYGFGIDAMKKWKVCVHCFAMNASENYFCTECGTRLPSENLFTVYKSRHLYCPTCETVVSDSAQYCPQCGLRMNKGGRKNGIF